MGGAAHLVRAALLGAPVRPWPTLSPMAFDPDDSAARLAEPQKGALVEPGAATAGSAGEGPSDEVGIQQTEVQQVQPAEVQKEVLGWLEFGDAARHLAGDVVAAGFRPELVVAIARGGLLLAGAVAYALGVKSCGALNVEFYTGIDERLAEPVLLPPLLDEASVVGKKVLLVDDVSDSGRTLALSVQILEKLGAEVKTVTLYTKPRTILEPDFFWRRTGQWIVFPWSALPPVAGALESESGA